MSRRQEFCLLRENYGFNISAKSNTVSLPSEYTTRNFDSERSVLREEVERMSKYFHKQFVEGCCVLENDSKYVEEFCTLIELCLQHGWKGYFKF